MRIVDSKKNVYEEYLDRYEKKFEEVVLKNQQVIFGSECLYIPIKKKIGKEIVTIPDGYLIDFTNLLDPILYFVEIELESHDIYSHISSQMIKFKAAYENDKWNLKKGLISIIEKYYSQQIQTYLSKSKFENRHQFLEELIYEKEFSAIIIINKKKDNLIQAMEQISSNIKIIEIKTFSSNTNKFIYIIDSFQKFFPKKDIKQIEKSNNKNKRIIDTIVVLSKGTGFEDVFIKEEQWYAIPLSKSMIPKLKYIAIYRCSPVSAITHIAKIKDILPYQNTRKYLLKFEENSIKKLKKPIKRSKNDSLRGPRYTTYKILKTSDKLSDL